MVNLILGAGPITLGLIIILTEVFGWPRWIHYIWGAIALAFGLVLLFV